MKKATAVTFGLLGASLAGVFGYNLFRSAFGSVPLGIVTSEGSVPILLYHNIDVHGEGRYNVPPAVFHDQLRFLYDHDFRSVSFEDYLANAFPRRVAAKKPVILTFDDSPVNHYKIEDGRLDKTSAVGVLEKFVTEYPDFGRGAVFFVDAVEEGDSQRMSASVPFGQAVSFQEKIRFLTKKRYAVQNHTLHHVNFEDVDTAQTARDEIEGLDRVLGFHTTILAYPFGRLPQNSDVEVYIRQNMKAAVTCENDLALLPDHVEFDPYRIPRIEMNEHASYKLSLLDWIVDPIPASATVVVPKRPIILDPGHGGNEDAGTTFLSIPEDELNYDISVRVRALLLRDGYTVHQTLYDSTSKYKPEETLSADHNEYLQHADGKRTYMKKKFLTRRCALADTTYTSSDNPLLVSIHVNSTRPEIAGASFYYPSVEEYNSQPISDASLALAEALQNSFSEKGLSTYCYDVGTMCIDWVIPDIYGNVPHFDKLALFEKTPHIQTKVLVETANAQNPADQKVLLNPNGRQKIAEAIYDGIVMYDQTH